MPSQRERQSGEFYCSPCRRYEPCARCGGGQSERQSVPVVSAYAFHLPGETQVEIARVGQMTGATFDYTADVWAIRCMSRCLNRDGFWEWEPLPSSRSDEFKARTRWTCEGGTYAAQQAVDAGNWPGGPDLRWKHYEEDEDV